MRRLSPLQRAYLTGFRRGVRWAWNRMCGKTQTWESEIASLQADYETLLGEMRQARDEQAVKQALVERATHLDGWLH